MAEESIPKRDPIEAIQKRAAEAQRRLGEREATIPKQLFLPGIEEALRAMPNSVARSSLFAPIARGKRKFHQQTEMVTRSDAVMAYTGEQLDEADADLTMQLLFEARPHPLGQPISLNRAALLRAMGRDTGNKQYEWLHRRMKALTESTLFIEVKKPDGSPKYRIGTTKAFHILSSFDYNELTETYTFTLDPRWQMLFSNREYSLLDWQKRLQLERDMAKALQRLVAASSDQIQRYNLIWLKEKMQYTSPMRKFRPSLTAGSAELERLGIIANWRIEESTKGKDQLVIWVVKD